MLVAAALVGFEDLVVAELGRRLARDLRTAESTPVSKSIRVPTTSKVRTLKLLNEAADDIFFFSRLDGT